METLNIPVGVRERKVLVGGKLQVQRQQIFKVLSAADAADRWRALQDVRGAKAKEEARQIWMVFERCFGETVPEWTARELKRRRRAQARRLNTPRKAGTK